VQFDRGGVLSEDDFSKLVGLKAGEPYKARRIRTIIEALYKTGKFKSLWIEASPQGKNHMILQFHWLENIYLASIRIQGNQALSEQEILDILKIKPGERFNETNWQAALSELASRYRRKGFFQAEIRSQQKPSADRQGLDLGLMIREGSPARIRKLRFLGEKVFSHWSLSLKIYSKKGELYQFARLQEDLLRLEQFYREAGYFKAVIGPVVVSHDPKTNEVELEMSIQASEHLEVVFEGEALLPEKELLPLLLSAKERSREPDVLEASARRMEAFYRSKGYPSPKVRFQVEAFPEARRAIVHFIIESGPRQEIESIAFAGNRAFSAETLQAQIPIEASRFFKRQYYVQETVKKSLGLLKRFYREAGFQSAQVKAQTQADASGKGLSLLFKISEGTQTRFQKVELLGNKALPEALLKSGLSLKPQMPYTKKRIQEGRRSLRATYAEQGYLQADIVPSLHFSLDQRKALLTYHISEGPQTRIGQIHLRGNRETQDHVILRELSIHPGAPYAPGEILKSQRRIYRTGHFSSVQLDPFPVEDKPGRQDIDLHVVERPRIALEFGLGFADRERFRGFIEASHRNLWGTGRGISARVEGSHVESRYLLNYQEPWLYGPSVSGRLSASYIDVQEVSFDLKTFSGIIGIDKAFSPTFKGSLVYQIERKQTSNLAGAVDITPEDEGFFTIGSLNPSLIWDTRDDPFNPRKGAVSSIVIRDAAKILGSEVQLVKLILQNRSFHPLSPRWVFAFSARLGVAERFGETDIIPLSERFFLGGRTTVRGYNEDKLGVSGGATATIVNGAPTGGNAMFVLNEELRLSLPKSFGLVFFLDHGNVWQGYREVSLGEVKSSAGIGMRYNTPIGPFRLDWGHKLNRESGESPSVFHFTLGHAF